MHTHPMQKFRYVDILIYPYLLETYDRCTAKNKTTKKKTLTSHIFPIQVIQVMSTNATAYLPIGYIHPYIYIHLYTHLRGVFKEDKNKKRGLNKIGEKEIERKEKKCDLLKAENHN